MNMQYDENGNMVFDELYFKETDGTVVHGVKWEYSYNGNLLSEGIQSMWEEGDWMVYQKEVYEYSGNLLTKINSYTWDEFLSVWDTESETSIKYDNEDREIESLVQNWSMGQEAFVNAEITTT
jgi:hypothetical protein